MAIDVKMAKNPPAGVKPPYAYDWKIAARVPMSLLLSVSIETEYYQGDYGVEHIPAPTPTWLNPTKDSKMRTTKNVIHHARIGAHTSETRISN